MAKHTFLQSALLTASMMKVVVVVATAEEEMNLHAKPTLAV